MERLTTVDAIRDRSVSPWGFVGVAGMVAMFFPYATSGLVAPFWAVGVLLVLWLAMLVVTVPVVRSAPQAHAGDARVAFVVWIGLITAGSAFLDWTA